MNGDRNRRLLWPLVLVVATSLLLGSISLIYPFGRDQGIHAFIAEAMLSGKVVYRDVFNIKPPLTTIVHATALILFGHSMTAIRILDLLWTVATALAVFAFASRAFRSRWVGAAAGCLYPLSYFPLGYWYTAQTDGWINLPVVAALLLFVLAYGRTAKQPRLLWLGSGVCCGLAMLLKYTIGLLPLLLLFILPFAYGPRLRGAAISAAWLLLGVLVPLVSCALVLLASGAMPAFIDSQLGLVPAYAAIGRNVGLQTRFDSFLATFTLTPELRLPALMLAAGALAAAVMYLRRPDWRLVLLLLASWLVVAFVSTFSQGKFFVYHFLPFLPVSALAGGLLVDIIFARLGRTRLPAAVGLGALLFVVSGFPSRFGSLMRILIGRESVRSYWVSDLHNMASDFSLRDNVELADYLRHTTLPTDRVFIWGFEPGVYFLAGRGTVTRFLYNFPMIASYDPQRFRAEFMRTFVHDPSELFVVEHRDATPWTTGSKNDSYAFLHEFPELLEFLEARYSPDTSLGRFDVFRLAAQP